MAIYTDNGLTLFDTHARSVTFDATTLFSPSTSGNAVMVDGVAVTGNTGLTGSSSGRIAALAQVRDTIAVTYQSQLDEIARGLIQATAESDQSASPTLPDAPGLFTLGRRAGHAGQRQHPGRPGRHDQGQRQRRPGSGRQPRAAARRRHLQSRQSGLCVQLHGRLRLLGSAEPAPRRAGPAAVVRSGGGRGLDRERSPASPPPRSPGCRPSANPRATTPTTRAPCSAGPPMLCPAPPASTSTRR